MAIEFMWGASAMAFLGAAVFFLRFWHQTDDRFFLLFALAFGALALNYALLVAVRPTVEARHLYFLVRLGAFLLIVAAIVDKNRREK